MKKKTDYIIYLTTKKVIERYHLFTLFQGQTRHDPGFCALFCYQNSPCYEKVELTEPFADIVWHHHKMFLFLAEYNILPYLPSHTILFNSSLHQ